jgi:hypothetical protein
MSGGGRRAPERAMLLPRRAATAAIVALLALSAPGHAECGPGANACEPSMDEARQKVQQLLDAAYVTPHTIASFEKLDGRNIDAIGGSLYEMRVFVVMNYADDILRCRAPLCPELHNYAVEVDKRAKTAKVAGWLFFKQTAQGWR